MKSKGMLWLSKNLNLPLKPDCVEAMPKIVKNVRYLINTNLLTIAIILTKHFLRFPLKYGFR